MLNPHEKIMFEFLLEDPRDKIVREITEQFQADLVKILGVPRRIMGKDRPLT